MMEPHVVIKQESNQSDTSSRNALVSSAPSSIGLQQHGASSGAAATVPSTDPALQAFDELGRKRLRCTTNDLIDAKRFKRSNDGVATSGSSTLSSSSLDLLVSGIGPLVRLNRSSCPPMTPTQEEQVLAYLDALYRGGALAGASSLMRYRRKLRVRMLSFKRLGTGMAPTATTTTATAATTVAPTAAAPTSATPSGDISSEQDDSHQQQQQQLQQQQQQKRLTKKAQSMTSVLFDLDKRVNGMLGASHKRHQRLIDLLPANEIHQLLDDFEADAARRKELADEMQQQQQPEQEPVYSSQLRTEQRALQPSASTSDAALPPLTSPTATTPMSPTLEIDSASSSTAPEACTSVAAASKPTLANGSSPLPASSRFSGSTRPLPSSIPSTNFMSTPTSSPLSTKPIGASLSNSAINRASISSYSISPSMLTPKPALFSPRQVQPRASSSIAASVPPTRPLPIAPSTAALASSLHAIPPAPAPSRAPTDTTAVVITTSNNNGSAPPSSAPTASLPPLTVPTPTPATSPQIPRPLPSLAPPVLSGKYPTLGNGTSSTDALRAPAPEMPAHGHPHGGLFELLTGTLERTPQVSAYQYKPLPEWIRRDTENYPLKMELLGAVLDRARARLPPKEREQLEKDLESEVHPTQASIDYCHIRAELLPAVNRLLRQFFWDGIDMRESLAWPDSTIVAMYKKLVIGCAFMTPDAYIPYIVVHPEWRRAGIARFMLYFLVQQAIPRRDVTLHVSVSNDAMLLYQQFGFKPEQYLVNFYDKYMSDEVLQRDPRAKDAFFLRLRS